MGLDGLFCIHATLVFKGNLKLGWRNRMAESPRRAQAQGLPTGNCSNSNPEQQISPHAPLGTCVPRKSQVLKCLKHHKAQRKPLLCPRTCTFPASPRFLLRFEVSSCEGLGSGALQGRVLSFCPFWTPQTPTDAAGQRRLSVSEFTLCKVPILDKLNFGARANNLFKYTKLPQNPMKVLNLIRPYGAGIEKLWFLLIFGLRVAGFRASGIAASAYRC